MVQYYVRTPNEKYNGKTLGVKFDNGKALVDERTIDPQVLKGRTVDDIARQMIEEFGYKCDPTPRRGDDDKGPDMRQVEANDAAASKRAAKEPPKRVGLYHAGA